VGPIHWRDIVAYAELHDLSPEMYYIFRHVIREMDAGYLEVQRAEMLRRAEQRKLKRSEGDE